MRKLLLALSLFIALAGFGQSEPNNPITYDTTIAEKANGEGPFTWQVRITRQKVDTSRRPAIITMPGSGETGTDPNNLTKFGPHYWLNNGWDGLVKLGNGLHYPILITLEAPAQNMRPWHLKALIEILMKAFPIKVGSVHVAGLSQGSYEWGELIGYAAYSGDQTAMTYIRSWVDLEGVGPGDNFLGFDPVFPSAYGIWTSKYGGKFFGLEGTQDSRNIWQLTQAMNAAKPGSAYFSYENIGGGAHCCWNNMYDPSVTNWTKANANIVPSSNPASTAGSYTADPVTGTNIFQWMLRQGDTSMAVVSAPPIIYKSAAMSGVYTRNCSCGTPTSVTYSVPGGKYTSTTSQAVADAQAVQDLATNGQNYANANGTCTPVLVTTHTITIAVDSATKVRLSIGVLSDGSITVTQQ